MSAKKQIVPSKQSQEIILIKSLKKALLFVALVVVYILSVTAFAAIDFILTVKGI